MSNVQLVNDGTFQAVVLNSRQPVLVDFFADWCGPCRMLAPVLNQLATEYVDRVKIVKVDVDQSPEVATAFRIEAMPTLILFENGKEMERTVGAPPAAQLRQMLSTQSGNTSATGE